MRDVQSGPSGVALAIDRVGVKDVTVPVVLRDRERGRQHTVAKVDLGADLPAHFKGTHMSRFIEVLENVSDDLDYQTLKSLLETVKSRLDAQRAYVVLRFPYFISRRAPATGSLGRMAYQCTLTGEMQGPRPEFLLEVAVPVMTVCPCSKAISDEGAHSQRAVVRISARFDGFVWLEELIEVAEASASSPVYTLLKREDEKAVTEAAFARPSFVEDAVRNAAQALADQPCESGRLTWFRVEVESFESIHNHSAFAAIEQSL